MQDYRGYFYYPLLNNKRVKVYVRDSAVGICFRIHNADDPQMWEAHGWVTYDAIQEARKMYTGKGFDPNTFYDIDTARAVLETSRQGK